MRSKAGRVVDFIEAWCVVPEGKLMGQWLVLENWQRESLYQIYNNDGKGGYLPEIELELRPYEVAPCWVIDPDDPRIDQEAAKLVREMRAVGVSQYHPNPMQAIKSANGRGEPGRR
jgi:hypothetical protein